MVGTNASQLRFMHQRRSTPPTIYARFSRRTTPNSSPREHPTDPETPLKLNGHTAHKTRIVMREDTDTDLADSAADSGCLAQGLP